MNRKIILLFLFSLALFGCKKESATQRPEFIGFWFNDYSQDFKFSIDIDENGYGVYYEKNMEGGGTSIKGDARVTDKKLKIGSLHHFTITEYPHQIDTTGSDIWTVTAGWSTRKKANWKMTLKGPNFYLGDGTYYKADY